MTQADDHRKRTQSSSPEKQIGVRSHDRKRRHTTIPRQERETEEREEGEVSPAPLQVPPPPNFARLTISTEDTQDMDLDEEDTLVEPQYLSSPSPSGHFRASPSPQRPNTPPQGGRSDPPWIIRRSGNQTNKTSTPPQLPKNLSRTPTPVGGFPDVHLSTPPWFNLLPEQRNFFESYQGPKLWVREWQGSNAADLMTASEKLKELIRGMTSERAKLSTPQQEKELVSKRRFDRHKPPYHFLVSGISERAYEIIIANPIISTPGTSAFFLPYNPPTPVFLCSIEGFTLGIRTKDAINESEDIATTIVRKTLSESEPTVAFIKSKLLDDDTSQHNHDPALEIIRTLEVRLGKGEETVDRSATSKPRKPLWNIFFQHTPPLSWTSYFMLLQHIRDLKFVDMDCGSAALVDERFRLHCSSCKGADHNPSQCEYTAVEGWYGNRETDKVEETAEFVSSGRNDKYRGPDRNRNERRANNWGGNSRGTPFGAGRRDRR
ncbi:hypothetical protein C0992_002505 [Termitomyces sp. T32_za158]|nr:hypothetical protein C0992_002505 [Termitomyces sp. T32_za158]